MPKRPRMESFSTLMASFRHAARTGQARQMRLASTGERLCSTGKKMSSGAPLQLARDRQLTARPSAGTGTRHTPGTGRRRSSRARPPQHDPANVQAGGAEALEPVARQELALAAETFLESAQGEVVGTRAGVGGVPCGE